MHIVQVDSPQPGENVTELREKGNECVRAGNFAEAILHYSHAIKQDGSSPQLYSNRSFAFLKLQQYYHALEDANEAIRLDPTWAKGYFRRGEVEFATGLFDHALESYRRASQLHNDPTLLECVLKANRELTRQQKVDQQTPWVGAGIGLILGVLVVVGDAAVANASILTHPVLQSLVTIVFSLLGLGLGFCYRAYIQNTRKALLERPLDLMDMDNDNSRNGVGGTKEQGSGKGGQEGEERRHHPRYTKARARQRYKKE
ncbi:heat shock protein sti1 homolog isoform X2 [Portunus trituberculatus]|uniref:heat shock protein sti1 homolog isoform X2 n=1 Tax=Portunus trituberculatus TaxID=210409 RepID=UPI001E1CEB6F|nr:heat shock protein sti1 homolog isoform X2 [Portunus trituberculatus]